MPHVAGHPFGAPEDYAYGAEQETIRRAREIFNLPSTVMPTPAQMEAVRGSAGLLDPIDAETQAASAMAGAFNGYVDDQDQYGYRSWIDPIDAETQAAANVAAGSPVAVEMQKAREAQAIIDSITNNPYVSNRYNMYEDDEASGDHSLAQFINEVTGVPVPPTPSKPTPLVRTTGGTGATGGFGGTGGTSIDDETQEASRMSALLGERAARRTIGDEFQRWRAQMPAFYSDRLPWGNLQRNLASRYMLDEPHMPSVGAGRPPTAGQYLQDYYGSPSTDPVEATIPSGFKAYMSGSPETLWQRAAMAGQAGVTPSGEYLGRGATPARMAYLATFGADSPSGAENQLKVANLLALQRQGGGMYRGRMADAVSNAMSKMQQYRSAQDYDPGTFLDWYVKQNRPEQQGFRNF